MHVRMLAAAAALGAAALTALPGGAGTTGNRPAAKYVAIQYDEIVRMVIAPATPPPPGSFQTAYAQIMSDAQNAPAQAQAPRRHGLAGLIGNISNVGAQMEQAGNQMQMMMKDGHLTRYTYYNNWVRTDDPVMKTAVIEKCAQHQRINLDLAHHTYKIADTSSKPAAACNTPQMPAGPGRTEVENEAPGTAKLVVTNSQQALGRMMFQNVPANGFDGTATMAMTQATGSCRNGSFTVQSTRYISSIAKPRAYCPLPQTRASVPTSPVSVVVHGGCKPSFTGNPAAMAYMREPNTLEMYTRMSMSGGNGDNAGTGSGKFMTVLERGNVGWYEKPQAEALFSVPAGFTQQQ